MKGKLVSLKISPVATTSDFRNQTMVSPEVVALGLAINQLQARTHEPLPRDIVMSIINTSQKAKFAEFELQLDWVSDAIELRLIERSGEVLCH